LLLQRARALKKDHEKAVKWYRKAAEQGESDAQYSLGNCYYNGEGVKKDMEKAKKWHLKAARQGHKESKKSLKSNYGITI